MLKDSYTALSSKFDYQNLENILKTIHEHFCDIFNLDILEQEAKAENVNSSYWSLFSHCMQYLDSPDSETEIVQKINEQLNEYDYEQFIFVPNLGNKPSTQLAFPEKTATGTLHTPEPLTLVDMRRYIDIAIDDGGDKRLIQGYNKHLSIEVIHLKHLSYLTKDTIKKNTALMVNFNRDLKGTPKWGVVDLKSKNNPVVFCEAPLSEAEKKALDEGLDLTNTTYVKPRANSLPSTGYSAVAWLEDKFTKNTTYDLDADFPALLENFLLGYFGGDSGGGTSTYQVNPSEKTTYFSKPFDYFFQNTTSNDSRDGLKFGYRFTKISQLASPGTLSCNDEINSFQPGDIQAVLEFLHKHTIHDLKTYLYKAAFSTVPGFAYTMKKSGQKSYHTLLDIKDSTTTLTIPENITFSQLENVHRNCCAEININSGWLGYVQKECRPENDAEFSAAAMVLTVVRAMAKKEKIIIHLPQQYQLKPSEQAMVVKFLADNAFVTDFKVGDNQSLSKVKADLQPIFARNRWLKANGYLPPLVDDYWRKAASYWLTHLSQQPDLLSDKEGHRLFKGCVHEMGIKGLENVLALLSDPEENQTIKDIYGKLKPVFYASCDPSLYTQYLGLLNTHLNNKNDFPFSEIGIAYHSGQDASLLKMLQQLNQNDSFDALVLTEFFEHSSHSEQLAFLSALNKTASDDSWTALIKVPVLEDESLSGDDALALKCQYTLLNNIILKNRRLKASNGILKDIKNQLTSDNAPAKDISLDDDDIEEDIYDEASSDVDDDIEDEFEGDKAWPLKRGGVVQLQLQQQMQIEQTRQVQQEQQKVVLNTVEEPINEELISYNNIDKILGQFYQEYKQENPVELSYASLKTTDESPLQGFFHTWVNGNPTVDARYLITRITQDALKTLIRHHQQLSSGLNPENLPKGFYTQRSKDDHLILCYSAECAYASTPTSLTPDLATSPPKAESWLGDFRQFDLNRYLDGKVELKPAFPTMKLFAALQPQKDYENSVTQFLQGFEFNTGTFWSRYSNPFAQLIYKNQVLFTQNWALFEQAYQYGGLENAVNILIKNKDHLTLSAPHLAVFLFKDQEESLRKWACSQGFTENTLRAFGQAYYQYDQEGLSILLNKLRELNHTLGDEFFKVFKDSFLAKTEDMGVLLSLSSIQVIDDMIAKLQVKDNIPLRQAWQAILEKHMEGVAWDNVDVLWRGFEYFAGELSQMGLELTGDEFDELKDGNMLVGMDRILNSLRAIPDSEQQQAFLNTLDSFDLTAGGVHYALQHERFKFFDEELKLNYFTDGSPTYAPDLAKFFISKTEDTALVIKRILASEPRFSHDEYKKLSQALSTNPNANLYLILLLNTQYETGKACEALDSLKKLKQEPLRKMAAHIYKAAYSRKNTELAINLDALVDSALLIESGTLSIDFKTLDTNHGDGSAFEALSILHLSQRLDAKNATHILSLCKIKPQSHDYPPKFYKNGLKIAALFNASCDDLKQYLKDTQKLTLIARAELDLLLRQVLSLDYATSNLDNLTHQDNWQQLHACIKSMQDNPYKAAAFRMAYLEALNKKKLEFKYSKGGDFRALDEKDMEDLGLTFFPDHQTRLGDFLQAHIALPVEKKAHDALQPVIRFFKRLQLNRTYLNEIEPLLSTLAQTPNARYWSVDYFAGMLRALQPPNAQSSFPISLLKVLLQEKTIAAKPIDELEKEFPQSLHKVIQAILQNDSFNRGQQANLCRLALHEYDDTSTVKLTYGIMNLLNNESFSESQGPVLAILNQAKSIHALEKSFANCRWLLQHSASNTESLAPHWAKNCALWLKAQSRDTAVENLFNEVHQFDNDPQKQAFILHILAFAALEQGLKEADDHVYELHHKTQKLVQSLGALPVNNLKTLAQCYPHTPAPGVDDLRRLLKNAKADPTLDFTQAVTDLSKRLHTKPREDYQSLAATREIDLDRMLREAQVVEGTDTRSLSAPEAARLTLILNHIKQLEQGTAQIDGFDKPLFDLTDKELAEAFASLSKTAPLTAQNDALRAQIWAVLFERMGRSTHKYPHLAQQFSLIANDCTLNAKTRVVLVKTGEGKSHFIALRAARLAGCGKKVDVCTAKRTLAERDLADYQDFFTRLGLNTAYIHAKSDGKAYTDSQIRYSTIGDISLFLDGQSYSGTKIDIDPHQQVGLFDEFDFIRFEEGLKTEYNYARPTGKTPKQMTWFYQAVNAFYCNEFQDADKDRKITKQKTLPAFKDFLAQAADSHEERENLINPLLKDELQLVQWLQSAHEAHTLEWGIGFTVREEHIEVGDESYPLQEIIPLSSDNQKMAGSTFSAGVHQLLAVRLNTKAKEKGESQNFHIHPESLIISSQVAAERITTLYDNWEGFSGTMSVAQSYSLHQNFGTQVLNVPTNRRDLRLWHKPGFYESHEMRLNALATEIRSCLKDQKSMLFSCQNDKKVLELQAELKDYLSENELAQLIFYTNEDKRSAKEVLGDKKEKEQWRGGRKTKAIGLVASGFGRGDNVGVEAVFLFDVNGTNDKLQKGGRTARNGAEGEVFQFYLNDELQAEKESLLKAVSLLAPEVSETVNETLENVEARDESERCFEQVMLLREYVFNLQNAANQGYRRALATLSSWGMVELGQIQDTNTRQILTRKFTAHLKAIDRQWIAISSDSYTNVDKKIEDIRIFIKEKTAIFSEDYNSLIKKEPGEFKLTEQQKVDKKLILALTPKALDGHQQILTKILRILSRLSGLSGQEYTHIPAQIGELAENSVQFALFAKQVEKCQSLEQFNHYLATAIEQLKNPSPTWQTVKKQVLKKIPKSKLFHGVSQKHKEQFVSLMEKLNSSQQTMVLKPLTAPGLLPGKRRVELVLPILSHLLDETKFSKNERQDMLDEYLANLSQLMQISDETPDVLILRLTHGAHLSFRHFTALGDLCSTLNLDDHNRSHMLSTLYAAIIKNPERHLRMLSRWESFGRSLDAPQKTTFLKDFAHTLAYIEEGVNWDTFENLVKHTQTWWVKGDNQAYATELQQLWGHLAGRAEHLADINPLIQWGLEQGGKSWFKVLNTVLSVNVPEKTLATLTPLLQSIWQEQASAPSKAARLTQFRDSYTNILKLQDILQQMDEPFASTALNLLASLKGQRFLTLQQLIATEDFGSWDNEALTTLLSFAADEDSISDQRFAAFITEIEKHQHTLQAYGNKVLSSLLEYAKTDAQNEEEGPLIPTRFTVLCDAFFTALDWHRYSRSNPNFSIDSFINRFDDFAALDKASINRLNALVDKNNTKLAELVANHIGEGYKAYSTWLDETLTLSDAQFNALNAYMNRNSDEYRWPKVLSFMTTKAHISGIKEIPDANVNRLFDVLDPAFDALFDETARCLHQGPEEDGWLIELTAFADDEYQKRVAFLQQALPIFVDYPEITAKLLDYAADEENDDERLLHLSSLLYAAKGYQASHPACDIKALLAGIERLENKSCADLEKIIRLFDKNHPGFYTQTAAFLLQGEELDEHDNWLDKLLSINDNLFNHLLNNLKTIEPEFIWHDDTWRALIKYAVEINENLHIMANERQNRLTYYQNLTQKVQVASNKLRENLAQNLIALDDFKDEESNNLERLNEIFDPEISTRPLFDNTIEFLKDKEEPDSYIAVINDFYEATQGKDAAEEVIESASIKKLFDFKDTDMRTKRIQWMQLLQDGAFAPRARFDENIHVPKNDDLLQESYDQYLNYTKAVLGEPVEHNPRGLSQVQELELLRIAKEMQDIAADDIAEKEIDDKDVLKEHLGQLLTNYNASWFKAAARVSQANKLGSDLTTLFNNDGENPASYQKVLETLHQAKKDALDADCKANQTRWIKLNSRGESRYLNTLNKMREAVLKHWAQNKANLSEMKDYEDTQTTALGDLANNLKQAVTAYQQSLDHQLGSFFITRGFKEQINELKNTLCPEDLEHAEDLEHQAVIDAVDAVYNQLPGHLKTLVDDYLPKARAFVDSQEAPVA